MIDPTRRYPPIGDYALLADCHSAALVNRTGSIDWACLRRFDAASAFGRILDWDRGGYFAICPPNIRDVRRRYIGESLVLETTFETDGGSARIVDAFAMRRGGAYRPYNQLVRMVEGVEGTVEFDVVIEPRFDYGELRPWLRYHGATGAFSAVGGDSAVVISTPCPLEVDDVDTDRVWGRLRVEAGQRAGFALQSQLPHELQPDPTSQADIFARLDDTIAWWHAWSGRLTAEHAYSDHIRRSAVVLKGLTCAPTGAMVAAPTTSLPEEIGGERNWDYRYTWIRDATLALSALSIAGHPDVAHGFRDFLMRAGAGSGHDLQIMYGCYGERYLPEFTVELEGYRGSNPVRIGNAAAKQTQHDMYGQILDLAHLWSVTPDVEERVEIDEDEWRFLRQVVEAAIRAWREPDRGIWEVRGEPRHFVHSKVLVWVALDRGIRIAEEGGLEADLDRWGTERDAIRDAVETQGVHEEGGYFTQSFGSSQLDAALLELPLVGFVKASDERMVRTVDAICERLAIPPHGFLLRYRTDETDDGLRGDESTFLMCSFWLVEVLAMQERMDEATALFERLLSVSNDLGLFAEEFDSSTGQLLGNFPQAFTHMALINAAHLLTSVREGRRPQEPSDAAQRLRECKQ